MAEKNMFEVVRPIGESDKKTTNVAARLPDLNGKTICELSSNIYNAHISFPIIREMLKVRYPDIKIIPYTEINESLPQSTIVTYSGDPELQEEKERAVIKIAREKGCEAFIIGNGG
jgi:hypothetical protein